MQLAIKSVNPKLIGQNFEFAKRFYTRVLLKKMLTRLLRKPILQITFVFQMERTFTFRKKQKIFKIKMRKIVKTVVYRKIFQKADSVLFLFQFKHIL